MISLNQFHAKPLGEVASRLSTLHAGLVKADNGPYDSNHEDEFVSVAAPDGRLYAHVEDLGIFGPYCHSLLVKPDGSEIFSRFSSGLKPDLANQSVVRLPDGRFEGFNAHVQMPSVATGVPQLQSIDDLFAPARPRPERSVLIVPMKPADAARVFADSSRLRP
jgi:hypothetical protein